MAPHPQTLLPTILKQLDSIHKKPALATPVLSAIRKVSQIKKAHAFLTPLLPPLTSITLTAPSHALRLDAAATCAALLNAFIARKVSDVAHTYVLDLVNIAQTLIRGTSSDFSLPRFAEHVTSACDTLPVSKPVTVNPTSLPSLLYLLALLIPSSAPLPPSAPAPSPGFDLSPSARLWFGIGARARAAVLNLVLSEALLSARCGLPTAIAAAYVWQRAFASTSAILVSQVVRKRLCAMLVAILKHDYEEGGQAKELSLMLYRLCMLASPSGKIPATLWATCGIRQAAAPGTLAEYLRSLSANTLVESCTSGDSVPGMQVEGPPRKRARVEPTPTQSVSHPSSASGDFTQSLSLGAGEQNDPATGLKRHLQALDNIFACGEQAESMHVLVHAITLTADSLTNVLVGGGEGVQYWVSFASSLSQMLRDLAPSILVSSNGELWKATMMLGEACLKLVSVLRTVKYLSAEGKPIAHILEASTAGTDAGLILDAVVCILRTACEAVSTVPEFPAGAFSELCWHLGEVALQQEVHVSDELGLLEVYRRVHAYVLDSGIPEAEAKAQLCRGVFRMCYAGSGDQVVQQAAAALPKLCNIVTLNLRSAPFLASSAIHGLCDVVCINVGCRVKHGHQTDVQENRACASTVLDEHVWISCFDVSKTILSDFANGDLLTAATRLMGVLALHAPQGRKLQCLPHLLSSLWENKSISARGVAQAFLSNLLNQQHSPNHNKILNESANSNITNITTDNNPLTHMDDTWDGPEYLLSNTSEAPEVLKALAIEMAKHIRIGNGQDQKSGLLLTERPDLVSPFALMLRLSSYESVSSKITGLATGELLSAAVAEMLRAEAASLDSSNGCNPLPGSGTPSFPIWFRVMLSVSLQTTLSTSYNPHAIFRNAPFAIESLATLKHSQIRPQIVSHKFCSFFMERISEWLPRTLNQLLQEDAFSKYCIEAFANGNMQLFWTRVSRNATGIILRKGNMDTLQSLAVKVKQPIAVLVDKICSDAFARAAMNEPNGIDMSSNGLNSIISQSLQQPLQGVISKRAGKIVQRLVMELGGEKDIQARRGLSHLAHLIQGHGGNKNGDDSIVGALVARHFMLVMDAVNRGLFHSKATGAERLRYMRMLEAILSLSQKKLHLFVPKILATLKLALDTDQGNQEFRSRTLQLWNTFLTTLGPDRLSPHLGAILSVLLPFFRTHEAILSPTVTLFVANASSVQLNSLSEIILLLRASNHNVLDKIANTLQARLDPQRAHSSNDTDPQVSVVREVQTAQELRKLTQDVVAVIQKYENGTIEVIAAKYLLRNLRLSRNNLENARTLLADDDESEFSDKNALPMIASCLVEHLTHTRNKTCQEVLLQCIGEVGAVNPSAVSGLSSDSSREERKETSQVSAQYPRIPHPYVALLLDDFLVPALAKGEKRTNSSSRQNRIGLVIQELLRACGCRQDTPSRASKTARRSQGLRKQEEWDKVLVGETDEENAIFFWENLLSTTRTVVQPYLSEPFDVQRYKDVFGGSSAGDAQLACQPVFSRISALSARGGTPTAQEWRRQMIVQLVDFIGKQGNFGRHLKALRPILRYEDNVAAFVFPLVVFTALDIQHQKKSTEIQNFLIQEISSVLSLGTAPQPVFDLFDTLRQWRDERCRDEGRRIWHRKTSAHSGEAGSHPRRTPLESCIEIAKNTDPLSLFVDLSGREAKDLSLLTQAQAALTAKSYSRAIMMAECHIRNERKKGKFDGWPSFIDKLVRGEKHNNYDVKSEAEALRVLQVAFAELEDADSMSGIAALRVSSSLAEIVLDNEAAGRYDEALTTYERALGVQPRSSQFHRGFLSCLMTLGHWESMLSHAEGLISSSKLNEDDLRDTSKANGIAAAWRLGRWDKLEDLAYNHVDESGSGNKTGLVAKGWVLHHNACLGKMFLGLQTSNASLVLKAASEARKHLLTPMLKAAREGYGRAYPMISLLHSLSDVEDAASHFPSSAEVMSESFAKDSGLPRLVAQLERAKAASSSLKVREPIISARRACFELSKEPNMAALVSLELASLAKESDNLQAALAAAHRAIAIASGDSDVLHSSVMEMAEIRRALGDFAGALSSVKKEIDRLELGKKSRSNTPRGSAPYLQLCEALVVAGRWIGESKSEPSDAILGYFERAAAYGPSREEPFYALGRHYDSLLQAGANSEQGVALATDAISTSSRSSKRYSSNGKHYSQYVPLVIRSFSKALENGHTRIFESLPRMLTVYFDYQTELESGESDRECGNVESEVKREMKNAFDKVGAYMWMTAVPQLLSRLCHPRKQVREIVTYQLARLTVQYPDQCSWTILPGSQLKTVDRKKAVETILRTAVSLIKKRSRTTEDRETMRVFRGKLQVAINVTQKFIDICEKQLGKEMRGRKANCEQEFEDLKRVLRASPELCPVVPSLDSLSVRLGRCGIGDEGPFSTKQPRIVDIESMALVMSSLMRPRRIGLIGSDGNIHRYLAKKENAGDMRKDSRLVELICVVNRLLGKEGGCGNKLALKTYAVLPLREESGMIEWVNNLAPLRNVVREQHGWLGVIHDTGTIQKAYQERDRKEFLLKWAFVRYPAVLDGFFMQRFGEDAQRWVAARRIWTESTAVWSMVGYVVGLGDRHGENVLIETVSGRCVHVDFAMLFDKGLKLKVAEIVPFRLTRNMVGAMGIAGYEGVFRKVCETVLGMMRGKAEAILGVLESFLHDPLADWGRSDTRGGKNGVLSSKEAWQTRGAVKAKLMGMVDNSGLPLSIKGQVQRLVIEATSVENLSRMYLWWSAWI